MTDNPAHPDLTASRGHVLVVDDDENCREFYSVILRKQGYEVMVAEDGMAALNLCALHIFDIVICDVRMPKLSGISFIKNVRVRSPESAKRVIFSSSMDDLVVKREAIEAGASESWPAMSDGESGFPTNYSRSGPTIIRDYSRRPRPGRANAPDYGGSAPGLRPPCEAD